MTVRVRGIYTTALTAMFEDVVQASPAIQQRFEESFPMAPAAVDIETSPDRQGVAVHQLSTDPDGTDAARVIGALRELGIDTLGWRASLPRGAVFDGEVIDTLGSGALLNCGDATQHGEWPTALPADGNTTGFLPYSKTDKRIEAGDRLRVQVTEPRPPWDDGRPVLDTTIRLTGGFAELVAGETADSGQPALADIIPAEPPDGWRISWDQTADEADLDALSTAVSRLGERATAVDDALDDDLAATVPEPLYAGDRTCWLWFGRESRFALDDERRSVTTTMTGHHRIKAGSNSASAAVDFVEDLCSDVEGEFPFDTVTRQFGPQEGETISLGHGKPDGRLIDLGSGTVTERSADGTLTIEREMSGHGTYDALGTKREPGDTATTTLKEGRWWYPTVYRSADGESRGTYVNVCTPVEVFPEQIRYVDLHVDVIKQPDGTVERVDEAELQSAVDAGQIPEALANKARTVATAVENAF